MDGNPGENLILFVFYVSLIGIAGAILVVVWVKVSDYISGRKAGKTPEDENRNI